MVARRNWTRKWWTIAFHEEEFVTSRAVIAELERGNFPGKSDAIALVENCPILEMERPVFDIVEAYVSNHVMPVDPFGDALHLALASYHDCDFLVTWNCRHLANANKFGHIRRMNGILGVSVPGLVTPLELLGEAEPI